ncbi:uncharacterized protein DNG_04565 [Cephalotrichum gorgonifer]|uniref:Zn(2)-C6 fungal-type domain-containing protein n=1 Tax=Cephalotrichum gorgonifer TaxID=2041049 RepID=A0AAE8SVC6_9PEZI|nr:uncharacterized protein DNG_04565 [Cephalotrichum gorgonifer]
MTAPTSVKRRRVRKGTHSCWECRRRKVKCVFGGDDVTCINCNARGSECISQLSSDAPFPAPDGTLALSLGRLEEMMGRLVGGGGTTGPVDSGADSSACLLPSCLSGSAAPSQPLPSRPPVEPGLHPDISPAPDSDLAGRSAVRNAQDIAIGVSSTTHQDTANGGLSIPDSSRPSGSGPDPASTAFNPSRPPRHCQMSSELYALLPSPEVRSILAYESPIASTILGYFHTQADQQVGKPEPLSSLASASYPTPNSHPVILARRLLQYAICLLQLPPTFDRKRLNFFDGRSFCTLLTSWVGSACTVTANDDLIGYIEGVECLALQSMFIGDGGHLRKSWMTMRRAMNMAQLMGINRCNRPSLRSCASDSEPRFLPDPAVLWYHINSIDRYNSLILGLPIGSHDNSFADTATQSGDGPLERAGKSYAVVSGQISDRNNLISGSPEAFALTQAVDLDLERTSNALGDSWWSIPDIPAALKGPAAPLLEEIATIRLQVQHFTLLLLLHLPYLLRDRDVLRYEYNRTTCMRASREILERFIIFRQEYMVYVSGRHIDYSALVAAMTLLLGYLDPNARRDRESSLADRELVEKTLGQFRKLSKEKTDRLSSESAETISQMLPILAPDGSRGGESSNIQVTVPCLGRVKINPNTPVHLMPGIPGSQGPITSESSASQAFPAQSNGDFAFGPPISPVSNGNMPSSQIEWPVIGDTEGEYITWEGENSGEASWPEFSAEIEDWGFQGVATTYWSMLSQSMT